MNGETRAWSSQIQYSRMFLLFVWLQKKKKLKMNKKQRNKN